MLVVFLYIFWPQTSHTNKNERKGEIAMGRDEHNNKKGKNNLAQTPKNQLKDDNHDIEFSEELADDDDRKAQARSDAAHKRAKKR